jgi:hypothetical protein
VKRLQVAKLQVAAVEQGASVNLALIRTRNLQLDPQYLQPHRGSRNAQVDKAEAASYGDGLAARAVRVR